MTTLITATMIILLLMASGAMIVAGRQAHHQKRQLARTYLLLATTLTGIGILLGSIQPAQPVIFVASLVLILASVLQLVFVQQQTIKNAKLSKQVPLDK